MKGQMKRRVLLAALLALTGAVCGCRQKDSKPQTPVSERTSDQGRGGQSSLDISAPTPVKVQLLLDSRYEPFRLVQMKMLGRLALSRAGVQLDCFDASGSAAAQQKYLVDHAAGTDFILLFPIDLASLSEILKTVQSHGTKVILLGTEPPADTALTSVFCDERKVGQIAGDYIVKALRQHAKDQGSDAVLGRVVYLQDEGGGPGMKLREEAFMKALAAEPGITLVHEAPVDASGNQAAARVAEAFRLQKNFEVIFADTDLIAEAASKAVAATNPAARESMLILGADGAKGKGGGVDLTIDSKIDATVLRPPLMDLAWSIVKKLLDDPTFHPKPRYELEPRLVTLETAMTIAREGLPASQAE